MDDKDPGPPEKAITYPLLGYTLMLHPDDPTMCILVMKTADAPRGYAMLREHVESIANALLKHAVDMPARTKRN